MKLFSIYAVMLLLAALLFSYEFVLLAIFPLSIAVYAGYYWWHEEGKEDVFGQKKIN